MFISIILPVLSTGADQPAGGLQRGADQPGVLRHGRHQHRGQPRPR